MAPIAPLRNYKILIVDSDIELANVLRSMLVTMGFPRSDISTSAAEALHLLNQQPYDFVITEWRLGQISGIEMVKKIRCTPQSLHPTIPIIMLTGRAEQVDVIAARDSGINEFVIKPFTVQSIYDRIERIIEHPRQFVISPHFVGPNRRARGTPPAGIADRRVRKIQPQLQPQDMHGMLKTMHIPRIWLPDFSLKYKLGITKLDTIITSAVRDQAQAAVDAISDASLGWVKENLNDMRILFKLMQSGDYPSTIVQDIAELALTINSRAGTFGYSRASEIAYLLYLFCRNQLNPMNRDHHLTLQKHIDVLHVVLGNQMRGSAGHLGEQLATELRKLADKFSSV